MDPNRPGQAPDPQSVSIYPQVQPQSKIAVETKKPSIISKALEIYRRFEPGKTETFHEEPSFVPEEMKSDFPFPLKEPYTCFSEDKKLAAHHKPSQMSKHQLLCDIVIFEADQFAEVSKFTVEYSVVKKCFSPENDYLFLFGFESFEARKVHTGEKLWKALYSDLHGFDRISFQKNSSSEQKIVKSSYQHQLIATDSRHSSLLCYQKKKTHWVLLTPDAILIIDMNFAKSKAPDAKRDCLWLSHSNHRDLVQPGQSSSRILIRDDFRFFLISKGKLHMFSLKEKLLDGLAVRGTPTSELAEQTTELDCEIFETYDLSHFELQHGGATSNRVLLLTNTNQSSSQPFSTFFDFGSKTVICESMQFQIDEDVNSIMEVTYNWSEFIVVDALSQIKHYVRAGNKIFGMSEYKLVKLEEFNETVILDHNRRRLTVLSHHHKTETQRLLAVTLPPNHKQIVWSPLIEIDNLQRPTVLYSCKHDCLLFVSQEQICDIQVHRHFAAKADSQTYKHPVTGDSKQESPTNRKRQECKLSENEEVLWIASVYEFGSQTSKFYIHKFSLLHNTFEEYFLLELSDKDHFDWVYFCQLTIYLRVGHKSYHIKLCPSQSSAQLTDGGAVCGFDSRLVFENQDHQFRIWDPRTGTVLHSWSHHMNDTSSVFLYNDLHFVVSTSTEMKVVSRDSIHLYDLGSQGLSTDVKKPNIGLSEDGRYLAVYLEEFKRLALYHHDGKRSFLLKEFPDLVATKNSERRVIVDLKNSLFGIILQHHEYDCFVQTFCLKTFVPLDRYEIQNLPRVRDIVISPDGQYLMLICMTEFHVVIKLRITAHPESEHTELGRATAELTAAGSNTVLKTLALDHLQGSSEHLPASHQRFHGLPVWIQYAIEDDNLFDLYEKNVLDVQALLYFHRLPEVLFDKLFSGRPSGKTRQWARKVSDVLFQKIETQVLHDSTFIRRFENIIIENRQVLASNMFARQFITNLIFCRTGETREGQLRDDKNSYVACEPSLQYDNLTQSEMLLARNPDNATTYELYRTRVPLDLSNGSQLSCTLFEMISKLSDADITGVYRPLIYYKWELLFNNCLAYTSLLWTNCTLAYIYLGFLHTEYVLGICNLVLTSLLILFEIKTFSSDWRVYLKSVWNYFDLVAFLFFVVTVIHNMSTDEEAHTLQAANVWLRLISVTLLGVRSLLWLRIFSPTRYMITMVMEVFSDFAPILIVFSMILLIYGYAWRLSSSLLHGGSEAGEMDFYESVLNAINLIFGNSPNLLGDDGDRFDVLKLGVYVIGNITLGLVLLNFLIALVSKTAERVSESREANDCRELLPLIHDFDMFLSWNKRRTQVQQEEVGTRERREQSLLLMVKQKDEEAQTERYTELHKVQQELNQFKTANLEMGTEMKFEIRKSQNESKKMRIILNRMQEDQQILKQELSAQKAEQEKLFLLVQHLVCQLAPLIPKEL